MGNRRASALGLVLLLACGGCGAKTIHTLGEYEPMPRFRDAGGKIRNINSSADDHNPTMTDDMLEIYFTSNRAGGGDVWYATRPDREVAFDLPQRLDIASSDADETSSAISPDGRTLWVGSKRAANGDAEESDDIDIWRTQRASRESPWEELTNVQHLNSDQDDIPRPVGLKGTVMPIASRRDTDAYQTYLAHRATPNSEFDPDLDRMEELDEPGRSTMDAFLTDDGLLLFFKREDAGDAGQLYMAWRSRVDEAFGEEVPLDALNTSADERDPWVNFDGSRFVFASNRGGDQGLDIYMTFVELPASNDLMAY